MALQGTLDTFALPDVLRLLASTKKTGRLVIQGSGGNGSLWLDDGAVVAGEVSTATTEGPTDVLFELLRVEDGSFLFDPDDISTSPGDATDVESLINESQQLHDEWRDLSSVIPSLDAGIGLVQELPGDTATIDRDRWRLLTGVGHGTTVRALGDHLGFREMPVLRAVRGAIDDGLVELRDDVAAPVGASSGGGALPALGDTADDHDLFGDSSADGLLPEPLPDGGGSEVAPDPFGEATAGGAAGGGDLRTGRSEPALPQLPGADPVEAAALNEEFSNLPLEARRVVVAAAEAPSDAEAEATLAGLQGEVDGDLLRRFLASVRS